MSFTWNNVPSRRVGAVISRAYPVGAGPLVRARIRGVVAYSAKLGRRRDVRDGADLFTVLPTGQPRLSPDGR
jgi:hypothetical protein